MLHLSELSHNERVTNMKAAANISCKYLFEGCKVINIKAAANGDIIRFIAHRVQDGYTLVENTLMTIKNPWEKKVSQNKWDTETSTT